MTNTEFVTLKDVPSTPLYCIRWLGTATAQRSVYVNPISHNAGQSKASDVVSAMVVIEKVPDDATPENIRVAILKVLYAAHQEFPNRGFPWRDMMRELGITQEEFDAGMSYLCDGGLVKYRTNVHCQITSKGIDFVEVRLKEPASREMALTSKRIFIGHGRSGLWRNLKDFIQDRLHLEWDEFNRESAAGISTQNRLTQMLAEASFAFLVMTADDEHADGSAHARENVIHEAGLFQGKLGFERAIILLEQGVSQFSNISGLTYISFPKGNIEAAFEDIRRVLERENIL